MRSSWAPVAVAVWCCACSRKPAPEAPPVAQSRALPHKSRGAIVQVDHRFRYDYYDVDEPDSSDEDLDRQGYQGGGPSWAGIVYGLVAMKEPQLMSKLDFDDEGDGLAIWSVDRGALQSVAELVAQAKGDRALLQKAIATAKAAGKME